MSSFIFQAAQLALEFRQPIWTSDGELLNNDRFVTYKGSGYDEGVKFTHPERDPDTFARLTAFVNEAAIAQNYIYKDVIQPFVMANWLPTADFKVLRVKRPLTDIVYSMLRMQWHYPAQIVADQTDLPRAVVQGLLLAEKALNTIPGEIIHYDDVIFNPFVITEALKRLYPNQAITPINFHDSNFIAYRNAVLLRRATIEYKEMSQWVEGIELSVNSKQ